MQRIPPIREVPSFEGSEDTSSESHSLYGFDRDVLGVRSVSPEELSDSAGYMTGVSDSSLGEDDGDPARQYRFFEREINLFRNREHNVYITPPLDHTNLLRMYCQDFLNQQLKIAELKSLCEAGLMPKSGKKGDLVQRVARGLDDARRTGNEKVYDAMVARLNKIFSLRGQHVRGLFSYQEEAALAALKDASQCLEFPFGLPKPTGFRIVRALSDPLYFPMAPRDVMHGVELECRLGSEPMLASHDSFPAVVFLKIYSHPALKSAAAAEADASGSTAAAALGEASPEAPRFRFSRGKRVTVFYQEERLRRLRNQFFFPIPLSTYRTSYVAAEVFSPIVINRVSRSVPYYAQIVLVEKDPSFVRVVPSPAVKNDFLKSCRADSSSVSATTVKVSLRCPLSLSRIKTPVRWSLCTHFQCIEKTSWDSYSQNRCTPQTSEQKCPICEKTSPARHLYVDGLMKEILETVGEDADEVLINVEDDLSDLKWSIPPPAPTTISTPTSKPEEKAGPVSGEIWIDLTGDSTVYDTPWVDPPARIKPDPGAHHEHMLPLKKLRPQPSTSPSRSLPLMAPCPVMASATRPPLADPDVCILDMSLAPRLQSSPSPPPRRQPTGHTFDDAIVID